MRPLGDRVLIRVIEEDWTRPSGLIIPENIRTASCRGEVVETGSDVPLLDKHDLAPGDRVIFTPYQEDMWHYEGSEYILVSYDNIVSMIADE